MLVCGALGDEPDGDVAFAAVAVAQAGAAGQVADGRLGVLGGVDEGDRGAGADSQLADERGAGRGAGVGDRDDGVERRVGNRLGEGRLDLLPGGERGVWELVLGLGGFSGLPPTKRRGRARSAFDWRTERATSRPCEGRRERSMTRARGGSSRRALRPREVPGTVASTS